MMLRGLGTAIIASLTAMLAVVAWQAGGSPPATNNGL
jgi:hypothetical protein